LINLQPQLGTLVRAVVLLAVGKTTKALAVQFPVEPADPPTVCAEMEAGYWLRRVWRMRFTSSLLPCWARRRASPKRA
jgi:hypothetical protein